MDNNNEKIERNSFTKFLDKIPLPVKAVITGLAVFAIGSYPALAAINFIPFPFSLLGLGLVLFLYLKFFSGRWGAKESASVKFRTNNFRSIKLSKEVWTWGITAALLLVAVQQSLFVVIFRLFEYKPEVMITFQLGDYPSAFLWLVFISSALIAGISEEVGFRGYMQIPLEAKYKPWIANVIVSVIFLVFHLNQGWAQPSLFGALFVLSFLFGMLAITTGSLIPSIIAHFVTDIFNFSYWWSDLAGKFSHRPISETGIDPHFIVWLVIFLSSLGIFLLVIKKLRKESAIPGIPA